MTINRAVLTTKEIAETAHYFGAKKRNRYAIPVAGPLQLPEQALPIPPHALGVWLGDAEWLKQLTAEQLVTVKNKRGFAKLEWQKLRERNEALDCRVYARAAAWILGADRWSDARWEDLERQLLIETTTGAPKLIAKSSPQPMARRRTVRSSYMG